MVAVESETRFLDAGMARIESSVKKLSEKAVKKGKMSEADAAAHVAKTLSCANSLARARAHVYLCVCANRWLGCTAGISPSLDRGSFAGCDIIIEAVIEDLALKKPLYEDIGRRAPRTTP